MWGLRMPASVKSESDVIIGMKPVSLELSGIGCSGMSGVCAGSSSGYDAKPWPYGYRPGG